MTEHEVEEPSADADGEIRVRRVDSAHAYIAAIGDRAVASLAFEQDGPSTVLIATTVVEEFRGRGVASGLITHVLDDLRAQGSRITVECPQVARFLEENGQYADLQVAT